MEDRGFLQRIIQQATDDVRQSFFPCLPRVAVVAGGQGISGDPARYDAAERVIKVSFAEFLAVPLERALSSLAHALVHFYGHLRGFLREGSEEETECFLCPAYARGGDVVALIKRLLRREYRAAIVEQAAAAIARVEARAKAEAEAKAWAGAEAVWLPLACADAAPLVGTAYEDAMCYD